SVIAVTGCSKSGDPCSGFDTYSADTGSQNDNVKKIMCNAENEVELRQLFLSSLYSLDSKPENIKKAKKWIDLALSGDAQYKQLSYRFLSLYYAKEIGNSSDKFLAEPTNVDSMKKML